MPKEERGFRYQKRTKDTLKERANMRGGNFDTIFKPKFKQWKPKDGKNTIRILPPSWKDAKHYGLDIFVNYNIGADNQSYLSLSRHGKGADPLAEARREAQQEGDKELAKALNAGQRILYWIIDRNDEDEGPLLWSAPFTFDKSLSNLCIDEDTKDVIFIDDPEEGCDVRFYKEGTGLKTTYDSSKMKVLKPSPLHEDENQQDDWLDFINENSLPEVLNFYDYDHIKAMFDGQIGKRDDDDEEEKPVRRRKAADEDDEKPVRRRASGGDDGRAVEDSKPRSKSRVPESDDEEEDEAPPRKVRSRAADDDEDEEKPSRSRRVSREQDPADDEVAEESPRRTRTRSTREEPEEKPRGRSRVVEPEEEDDDPPSTRRTSKSKDEDEDGGTLRERLARRRSRTDD